MICLSLQRTFLSPLQTQWLLGKDVNRAWNCPSALGNYWLRHWGRQSKSISWPLKSTLGGHKSSPKTDDCGVWPYLMTWLTTWGERHLRVGILLGHPTSTWGLDRSPLQAGCAWCNGWDNKLTTLLWVPWARLCSIHFPFDLLRS